MRLSIVSLLFVPLAVQAQESTDPTAGPLASDMQTHWTFATHARDGVIHADLAEAHLWGRGMSELSPPEALPTAWRPMYAEMRAASARIAEAEDLLVAGQRVGELALTCSECHSFTGGGPGHLVLPLPKPRFDDSKSDMALHEWATQWLWVGLIANDSEAWRKGADALIEEPFQDVSRVPKKDASQMEHVVHLVASMAEPSDRAEQAERFGQLITACALCHTDAQKGGVKGPPQ